MSRRFVLLVLVPSLVLATKAELRAEIVERVIAKVNGEIITLSEFQTKQIAAAQAARVETANVGAFLRQNNARILQEAIDDLLLLQKAQEAGVSAPQQWVDEAIENIKKDNNLTTEDQLQEALQREGMTLGELRRNIERGILKRWVFEREIRGRVEVTETELKAEYEKRKASEFTKPPTVSLQEILVDEKAGGLPLAREIVEKARAGEDFAALVKAHSAAPSKANGGDLGEIAATDMSKDMARVTAALPVGGVSDPMPVEGGYHILKVTARTEGSTTPYEGAKEKLRNELEGARLEKQYDDYVAELRKNAQIALYVREVPLQLNGPIPEGSLLESLDPTGPGFALPELPGEPGSPPPASSRPQTPSSGDEEIQTTPQAAPERVPPPAAPGAPPPAP